jgi:hypothetical protein
MGGFFGSIDPDFTPLGTKAVFAGEDTSFHYGLWVTDGTLAGTSELAVPGARAGGLFAITFHPDLTVFGGKALFEGYDASNRLKSVGYRRDCSGDERADRRRGLFRGAVQWGRSDQCQFHRFWQQGAF